MISRNGIIYPALRKYRNRLVLASKRLDCVHETAYVHPTSHVARDLRAGEYAFIGRDCALSPLVTIGRYTMLASNIAIVGDDHNWTEPGLPIQFAGRPPQRTTTIGADAWLGHGVIILRGVEVGNGSIVAAGAVVTKNVPAYEIWAGTPAQKIGVRFSDVIDRKKHETMLEGPVVAPAFAGRREDYKRAPHDTLT